MKWFDLCDFPPEPPRVHDYVGDDISNFIEVDEFADLEIDEDYNLVYFNPKNVEECIEESLWNTHFEGNTETEVIPRTSLKELIQQHHQYEQFVCACAAQGIRQRVWEAEQAMKAAREQKAQSLREKLIAKGYIKPAVVVIASQSSNKENISWQPSIQP